MADERKQMLLRMSPALWAELSRWAAAEFRSTNALVEYLLTEAVRRRGKTLPPPPGGSGEAEAPAEGPGGGRPEA